jgi:hypothetical protein
MSNGADKKLLAVALARLQKLEKQEAFDPNKPSSRPTEKQAQVFSEFGEIKQQWIRAGNQSGKSQTCARIVTWVLTDTHPNWKRPADWADEPLLVVVCGRTGKQLEESLLPKIESFLEPGSYKVVRVGNMVQRLEINNGNRVVFQSLENPNVAQQRLQSYVAHLVWVDELPPTMSIVRELLIRVQARDGYFLASFTPTVVNIEIQQFVDNIKMPEGKVYTFNMLDNPLYSSVERRTELIGRYAHLPEHVRATIFEGAWSSSDDQVYYFDYPTMVEMPQGYSPLWRHVESVDPALKSALGLTVWAENPVTGMWYCVIADYVRGIHVPTEIVQAVAARTANYNIVKRIADPHEVWYIQTAASMNIKYVGVYNKNSRKGELIKNLQQSLGAKVKMSPTVTDLIGELQTCRWSEKGEGKIVNSSSYHLLDSAQYFVDEMPKYEGPMNSYSSWEDKLYQTHMNRKKVEDDKAKKEEQRAEKRALYRRGRLSRRR